MSSREKKLLSLLLLAGFLMFNLFLYSQYLQKKNLFENALETAKIELQQAKTSQDNAAQYAEQMQWLAEHEPDPTNAQTVEGKFYPFVENQAVAAGLEITDKDYIPANTTGKHYHRAHIQISVTGREESLYRWLNAVNDPSAFRSAIQIVLKPNTDDTLIDCVAHIFQWFPPEK